MPEISTPASLVVIVLTLIVTVIASLLATKNSRVLPVAIGEEIEEIKRLQDEK